MRSFIQKHWRLIALAVGIGIAVGIWTNAVIEQKADEFAAAGYNVCLMTHYGPADPHEACKVERKKARDQELEQRSISVGAATIASGLFAAATLSLVFAIWRLGNFLRREKLQWSAFSLIKKIKVAALALWAFLLSASFILYHEVLVMKAKSPPSFGTSLTISDWQENYAWATGAMVSEEDGAIGTKSGDLDFVKIVKIECDHEKMQCSEAVSELSYSNGDWFNSVDLVSFDIISWVDGRIIFGSQGLCSEQSYTMDLKAKSLTGYTRDINTESQSCKHWDDRPTSLWRHRLADPFPIYWRILNSRRPFLLRVISASNTAT